MTNSGVTKLTGAVCTFVDSTFCPSSGVMSKADVFEIVALICKLLLAHITRRILVVVYKIMGILASLNLS